MHFVLNQSLNETTGRNLNFPRIINSHSVVHSLNSFLVVEGHRSKLNLDFFFRNQHLPGAQYN